MHLSEELLVKIADMMCSVASYRKIAEACGISEGCLYNWRAACERDRKANDLGSPFYIPFRGEQMWWTSACALARREHLATAESVIRAQTVDGIETVVRDASQRVMYRLDPRFINRPDEFVELSEGCAPSEVAWHRLLHDENGLPIPETTKQQVPAQLKLAVLAAAHDDYQNRQTVEHHHSGDVVHHQMPMMRKPGERPSASLEELRALARLSPEARRAKINASAYPRDERNNRTIPQLSPPSHGDQPDDQGHGLRPAPQPYTPQKQEPQPYEGEPRPRPAYAKVPKLDQASYGEGVVPPNGFKVA